MEVIRISGAGCCLMDYLYAGIDFSSEVFARALSRRKGDGGLSPGGLVFLHDFEKFIGRKLDDFLRDAAGDGEPSDAAGSAGARGPGAANAAMPTAANVGGPSIVSLIHAAQLLDAEVFKVAFYGCRGRDETGKELAAILSKTPVDVSRYTVSEGMTPFTVVLSDPDYDDGHGERAFINSMGTELGFGPESLDDAFFKADIVAFGGTALVPRIHDALGELTGRAKKSGAVVIVNTVYDFRSQAENPGRRWPLGKDDETYRNIDLLVADREEALRLSGGDSIPEALGFFKLRGTGAAVVTDGTRDISFYTNGTLFGEISMGSLPIRAAEMKKLAFGDGGAACGGDTTGCGDNFAGGLIAYAAERISGGTRRGEWDIADACTWAIASGGFASSYIGGAYLEKKRGEKRALVERYRDLYKELADGGQ